MTEGRIKVEIQFKNERWKMNVEIKIKKYRCKNESKMKIKSDRWKNESTTILRMKDGIMKVEIKIKNERRKM